MKVGAAAAKLGHFIFHETTTRVEKVGFFQFGNWGEVETVRKGEMLICLTNLAKNNSKMNEIYK